MINEKINVDKICDLIESFCTDEWRSIIDSNKTTLTYPKDVKIFETGQDANVVQIIETGKVKIISEFEGSERIIRLAGDGMIIGHRGFGGQTLYSVSAVSLTPVKLISIPRKIFDNVLKANSYFCYYLLMFFAEELKRSEKLFQIITSQPVKIRVSNSIKMCLEIFGKEESSNKLNFSISRKDIASICATTYESVIRSLTDLQKDGLIKISGKEIEILNKDKLFNLCEC